MLHRRTLLAATAGLAAPALVRAQSATTLRFVPQADLASLDPIWTTAYQTRDHAFLVFDTLFGQDGGYRAQPQMLAGFTTAPDGLAWTLTLRDGLRFHDGTPVLARDCVASIRRWGARDSFGQALLAAAAEIAAPDDRTILIRLTRPFSLLPDALGKTPPSPCVIMPERLARTDAFTQVTEMVGSGPYRFVPDERVPGDRVVYAKFDGYVPREGAPDRTAGGKRAVFDRIEWRIIQDSATQAAALQRGEVDWVLVPDPELLPLLRRDAKLVVETQDPTGIIATMRFNQLQKPFDNAALRRAVVSAVDQADYMIASTSSDTSLWRDKVGYFCPGTPLANDAGMAALTGPRDLAATKRAIAASGYAGERVVLLAATDIPQTKALGDVTADLFQKIGLNLDVQSMDWGTLVQRRTKTDPVEAGGWSVLHTSWSGLDQFNPAGNVFLRGNGRKAAPGWPDSPALEALRDEWLLADGLAAQQAIARRIQAQAFVDVPYVPLGQALRPTAYRGDLRDMVKGLPVFWGVRRG